MSRKNKNRNKNSQPANADPVIGLHDLERKRAEFEVLERDLIEKSLRSSDPHSIMKAQNYLQTLDQQYSPNGTTEKGVKAFLYSPEMEYYNSGGFRQPIKAVSHQTLRSMARTPVIKTIIGTRVNQVADFSEPSESEQEKGWMIRKKPRRRKDEKDTGDKKILLYIENFILNGGSGDSKYDSDGFDSTLRAVTKDSLEVDQLCIELIPDRQGRLSRYVPVDGTTMRLVDSTLQEKNQLPRKNGYYPKYVQVWMEQAYTFFYPWEMSFGIRNKTTDIYSNGYGISELEDMVQIVTWILYGTQYNGNFFSNGSNPKGFFSIEGSVAPNALSDFKQMWRNTIVGVQNCLSGDSYVWTEEGQFTLKQLIGEELEVRGLRIWDGLGFCDAIGYRTKVKKNWKLSLNNGTFLNSSPDHKILVVQNMTLEMVPLKDLKVGDYAVVNKKELPPTLDTFTYKNTPLEEDLWEVLGWMTGDGCLHESETYGKGITGNIGLFYHSIKEQDIREAHFQILKKYSINCQFTDVFYTEEQKEKIKVRYGFKSVADKTTSIDIFDSEFLRFLVYEVGFRTSKNGKVIPSKLFVSDEKYRYAFLRGYFSADGSVESGRQVRLTCCQQELKEQTRLLLLSVGIRCNGFKGTPVTAFNKTTEDWLLSVKDRDLFFEKCGFLQEKKQKTLEVKKVYTHKTAPKELVRFLAKEIRKQSFRKGLLSSSESSRLSDIIGGFDNSSLDRIKKYAEITGAVLPEFIYEYDFEEIVSIEKSDEEVQMYDIEMLDEKHQLVVNGILTSNSHKVPVIESGGAKINWIPMQMNNRDMEFQLWMDFLISMSCAIFKIDPTECGFNLQNSSSQMFGQDGQKERLKHSQSKGLVPILKLVQRTFTKFIVEQIDEDYEFIFTGVEQEDQIAALDMDVKKVSNGGMSMEDMFEKYSGRKLNPEKDTILNQVWLQMQAQKQMGGDQMNGMVDEEGPGGQEESDNPFEKSLLRSLEGIGRQLNKKG